MERSARILVLGAGAVGLPLAARLSRVADVVAVTREHYARAVFREGLMIHGAWGTESFRFSCVSGISGDEEFDYILITSKSQDTERICRQYGNLFRESEVVSFQNGIGNEETISRFTSHVIGGVVLTGFVREGDREIHATANAGPLQIGRFPEGLDAGVTALAEILKRAGIPVETTERIKSKTLVQEPDQLFLKSAQCDNGGNVRGTETAGQLAHHRRDGTGEFCGCPA